MYVAEFPPNANPRSGEDLLGRLCAEGDLDVLDGVVVYWPPDAPSLEWRPLRNVPRRAALAESAWAAAVRQPGQPVLPPLVGTIARDRSTIIAICVTPRIDVVRDELVRTGASVRVASVSDELYTELRDAFRSR